jgi:hypothetical protein
LVHCGRKAERQYLQIGGQLGQGVEETEEELVDKRREMHGGVRETIQHELVLRLGEHAVDPVLQQLLEVSLSRALAGLRLRVAFPLLPHGKGNSII